MLVALNAELDMGIAMIAKEVIEQVVALNKASFAAQMEVSLKISNLMTEKTKIADEFAMKITNLFDDDVIELAHELAISENPYFEPLGAHRINATGFSIYMNDGFDNVWIDVPFEKLASMTV